MITAVNTAQLRISYSSSASRKFTYTLSPMRVGLRLILTRFNSL